MKNLFPSLNIEYKKGSHVPALDGVRGAGIIFVILYHYFLFPYASWFSMESFFVLSGFLITGILLDTKDSANYFKNYLARRMLRILPLYYGLLLVVFFIIPLFVSKEGLAPYSLYYNNQGYFWSYMQNWLLLHNEANLKGTSRIMLHLWSLAIEEQFYIVWPFLVLIFSRKAFLRFVIVLIFLSIGLKWYFYFAGYSWQNNYFNTFCRLDSLAMGGLLAICIRDKTIVPLLEKIAPYAFKLLGSILLIAIIIYRPRLLDEQFLEPAGPTLFAIVFSGMVLYCVSSHEKNYVKNTLQHRIFIFLGKYSYSLYIFHVPILALMRPSLTAFLAQHMKGGFAFAISNVVCLAATILFAQFTWVAIEKPALKLKKFFKYDAKKPLHSVNTETESVPVNSL